ncbi:MAG: tetratricopeptide repeat protein [Phycisphaeraceae bacterium]
MTITVKLLSLILLSLCLSAAGCVGDGPAYDRADAYRTVDTAPRRNTDVAKRENQTGVKHLEAGDLGKAADAFNHALTADVAFGPAHNNLGKIYHHREDWYRAAWEFEYAAKLMPEHGGPHNNLGLVLEQVGSLDRAVAAYEQAVALDPENLAYAANLARALIRRGDRTEQTRALLQRLLEQETRPQWVRWARQQMLLFTQ